MNHLIPTTQSYPDTQRMAVGVADGVYSLLNAVLSEDQVIVHERAREGNNITPPSIADAIHLTLSSVYFYILTLPPLQNLLISSLL